jgi:hypothetical protein
VSPDTYRLKLQLEKENIVLREKLQRGGGFSKIIGSSEALHYLLLRVEPGFRVDVSPVLCYTYQTGALPGPPNEEEWSR